MCLAIPAQVKSLDGQNLATVDIMGVSRSVSVDLTPTVSVGEFVLVHAGFAIEVIDEAQAKETLELIAEFPSLAGDDLPQQQVQKPAV